MSISMVKGLIYCPLHDTYLINCKGAHDEGRR